MAIERHDHTVVGALNHPGVRYQVEIEVDGVIDRLAVPAGDDLYSEAYLLGMVVRPCRDRNLMGPLARGRLVKVPAELLAGDRHREGAGERARGTRSHLCCAGDEIGTAEAGLRTA